MKKRVIATLLIACVLLQSVFGYEKVSSQSDLRSSNQWENVYQSPALQNFLRQIDGRFTDDDTISVLVEVEEEYINEATGLESVDKESWQMPGGIGKQFEYNQSSQQILLEQIRQMGIPFEVKHSFDVVFNGFEMEATVEAVKQIAMLKAVKNITYNETIFAPDKNDISTFHNKMIQLEEVQSDHSENYRGKNQLIAVIDTGADQSHQIFAHHDASKNKIEDQAALDRIKRQNGIAVGKWFSNKIPFGYNYAFDNNVIKEISNEPHGMHVAGIAVANAPDFKGVAPDAQLAVMRVFGDNGKTSVQNYLRALEDAIKLGADSINMSLGTPGGSRRYVYEPVITALENAKKAGIVVAIATGNSGYNGWQSNPENLPDATNPDFGILGVPAVIKDSLAVAAVNSSEVFTRFLGNNQDDRKIIYKETRYVEASSEEFGILNGGYGHANELEQFKGKEQINKKYVLVQRGDQESGREDFTYAEKVTNVKAIGAAGIIIYNNLNKAPISDMDTGNVVLPAYSISKEDGQHLLSLLASEPNTKISFAKDKGFVHNPLGYEPSDFSSWGVTPEGELKPDISAPGGEVYSSFNDNRYGVISGTSMASPYVAGGIVIVKEYVEKQFDKIDGADKHKLIKNLLMSTAKPYQYSEDTYYSPRKQGAGLMQLRNAIHASVVAEDENGISSINIKQISGNTVNVRGKLRNYGTEAKTFQYQAFVHSDSVEQDEITLKPRFLKKSEESEITVQPGQTTDFAVAVTLEDSQISQLESEMPNGFFLEGYVFFKEKTDGSRENHPEISIPFVAFRGNWKDIPVIEKSIYDYRDTDKRPFYFSKSISAPAFTHLGSTIRGKRRENSQTYTEENVILGHSPVATPQNLLFYKDKIAFSPNDDNDADKIQFYGTFLRDYSDLILSVYQTEPASQTKTRIYQSGGVGQSGKRVIYEGINTMYTQTHNNWTWTGRNDSGAKVQDGDYELQISVKSVAEDATPQIMKFPVKVDTVAPHLHKTSYELSTRSFNLEKIVEEGSGIRQAYIVYDSDRPKEESDNLLNLEEGQSVTLKEGFDPEKAKVVLIDYAYNKEEISFEEAVQRDGNKHALLVQIETDLLNRANVKWEVYSKPDNQKVTDFGNLKPGSYTLRIVDYNKAEYRLVGSETIDFEIAEDEPSKSISISLKYRQRITVRLRVDTNLPNNVKLFWKNTETGERHQMRVENSGGKQVYLAFLEYGNYLLEAENLTDQILEINSGVNTIRIEENGPNLQTVDAVVKPKTVPKPPVTEPKPTPPAPPAPNLPGPKLAPAPKPPINAPVVPKPTPVKPVPKPEIFKESRVIEQKAYVQGSGNGYFYPDQKVNRAEVAVMLNHFVASSGNITTQMTDVKSGQWYSTAISNLVGNGIISGYPDGSYKPFHSLTRAELISLIVKLKGYQPTGTSEVVFRDMNDAPWAKEVIAYAAKQGWMKGYEDGTVRPNQQVSRAEAVVMINRAFGFKGTAKQSLSFLDVKESHWAYLDILIATQK